MWVTVTNILLGPQPCLLILDLAVMWEIVSNILNFIRPLALPVNIRLGWKWLTATNTLAYDDTGFITDVKGFLEETLEVAKKSNQYFFFFFASYFFSFFFAIKWFLRHQSIVNLSLERIRGTSLDGLFHLLSIKLLKTRADSINNLRP